MTDESLGFTYTDDEGYYSSVLPTGTYDFWFWFEPGQGDAIAVNLTESGATYNVDYAKGVIQGVLAGVSESDQIIAIARPGPWNVSIAGATAADGSFVMRLAPGAYTLFIMGSPGPFASEVSVDTSPVTDLGTIKPCSLLTRCTVVPR